MSENDRPQDVGRAHHRRAMLGPATTEVLERYRVAMRTELGNLLEMLSARRGGLLDEVPGELVVPIAERMRLWDLAIKLGRELASGGTDDPEPAADPAPLVPATARRRQAPRISARDRRSLGG